MRPASIRPANLFTLVGLFLLLSCGENPTAIERANPSDPASMPQLQRGVGEAPVARPGGTTPTVPNNWSFQSSEQSTGPATTLPTTTPKGFSPRIGSIVAANASGNVRHLLLENAATGDRALWVVSSGSIVNSASLGNMPTSWHIKGSGDYNADGFEDILWENIADGSRAIWLMDGNGGVTQAVSLGVVPTEWRIAGGGDYDGDGKDDILWENISTGSRALWLMNGGQVLNSVVVGTLFDWHMIAAPDLNSDGKADILLESTTNGNKVLWTMVGGAVHDAVLLGALPREWKISAGTDIDGDGKTDVLLENVSTGARAAWLEDGHGGVTSAPLLTILDPVWHMAAALVPNRLTVFVSAGDDQDKNRGEATTLDGSASTALSGATYTWTQVSGPDVTGGTGTLTGVSPTFTAPGTVSTLEFDLRITTQGVTRGPDRVVVFVFEDKAHTVFVAPTGNDANAGTRAAPVRTITAAINKSGADGLSADVYVQENGTAGYVESPILRDGVSVYGGYCGGWLRDRTGCVTRIIAHWSFTLGVRSIGTPIANFTFDGFTVQTQPPPDYTQESSYGMILYNAGANVIISNNVFNIGPGALGGDGRSYDIGSYLLQYYGGGGGAGGQGGRGADGKSGQGPLAGAGGLGGGPAARGSDGTSAAAGADAPSAPGGGSFGSLSLFGGHVLGGGENGAQGGLGSGGGGGGGGGGHLFAPGGNGGAGGSGGNGGYGGGGGVGGGGSFGIVISHATASVAIIGNTITTSNGGNGGIGGAAEGGYGGAPGSLGSAGIAGAGGGGTGGSGGAGGHGGAGGGGGGGPSVGIVESSGIEATKINNIISVGPGGLGGAGGSASNPGLRGMSIAILRL